MKTAADLLKEKGHKIISVSEDAKIIDAVKIMNEYNIGAILITDKDGNYVGIWTERDLMRNIVEDDFDLKNSKIKDFMITKLITSPSSATIYDLMDKFLGKRFRHMLIEEDGKIIGLLSIGDVIKADLNEKTKELEQLHAMVNWEYYDNWRWDKK